MPTCAHKFALFWLAFNRAVKPHVDTWYRVEHTPPCEVAALGGFMNSTAVVYEPHFAHVHDVCSQVRQPPWCGLRRLFHGCRRRSGLGLRILYPRPSTST
eukprot:420810-Prorocentrum_minimum.AAC.1